MYVKNSNFAIYLVLAALVGFGISFLFLSSNVQDSLLSGDISKANVYSNQKDDPEFSVIEEKLANDEEFFNTTKDALSFIGTRVDDLEELTSKTIEVCSDIPEFKNAIKDIISLNAKAYNTQLSINSASSGLDKLANGKKAPDYEQSSNNVFIGFQKIENQLAIGKAFYETASAYLEGKEGEEYNEIAELAAKWSIYCAQDAYLNSSNEDLAYWENQANEASAVSPALLAAYDTQLTVLQNGAGRQVLENGAGRQVLENGAGRQVLENGAGRQVLENVGGLQELALMGMNVTPGVGGDLGTDILRGTTGIDLIMSNAFPGSLNLASVEYN